MATMSKWERIQAAIHHQPTDRIPWSFWRHFYHKESSARDLAGAMLLWQETNDFDLLKVNPRAEYHAEIWGARYRPSGHPLEKPTPAFVPVHHVSDWRRIEALPPSAHALEEQLQALSLIRRGLGSAVPFVETVFSPLSVAGYLIEDNHLLLRHMLEDPDALHQALRAIAETFASFVQEVLNSGASGVFFATTGWATYDLMTDELYDRFGRPYDLQVLAAAKEAQVNVLHVCRAHNMLRRVLDYPVHILNWAADAPGNDSLGEIADRVPDRAVAGGISNAALTASDPAMAIGEARVAAEQARDRGLLIAGNCSIPVGSSQRVIDGVREWLLRT